MVAILAFGGVFALLHMLYHYSNDLLELIFPRIENFILFFYNLSPQQIQFLENDFYYYSILPSYVHKVNFQKRVARFIKKKDFVPRGNLEEITEEMKLLISSTAIKLTFGYSNAYLSHFRTIIVFPTDYFSKSSKQNHQGEVNPKGILVFSWNNFLAGFEDRSDGRNLGIHEMAHALFFEHRFGKLDENFMKYWRFIPRFYLGELNDLRNGVTPYFREYALENEHEFFAVAVEEFFERPKELLNNHHQLYVLLAKILNQDPSHGTYPEIEFSKLDLLKTRIINILKK